MRVNLAGRIALVTGAQQGIGADIAVELAEEGADVAISWLDDEPAAEAVSGRVRQAGRRVHVIRTDVARLSDIESMVAGHRPSAWRARHPGQQRWRLIRG